MRQLVLGLIALILMAACGSDSQQSQTSSATAQEAEVTADRFAGDWSADLQVPAGPELRIILHIVALEDDTFEVSMDVPQQGAFGLPGENGRIDESKNFIAEFPVIGASLNLKREGETLIGAFIQGLPLPITFNAAEDLPPPSRPQESALERDYEITEVSFAGGDDGVVIAGELTRPRGEGPFAAAVLISGSGPQDRNEELMGHKPFLILSDYLTSNGYAVLRYDDRGTAESTGDHSTATTQDFANDAAAALRFLRAQERILPNRVGYIGHSEGGFIAPLATQIAPADFMVFLAGPSQPLPEVIIRQSVDIGKAGGMPDFQLKKQKEMQINLFAALRNRTPEDDAFELAKSIIAESNLVPASALDGAAKRMTNPWMLWMVDFDPLTVIAEYDGPVLALFGAKDLQVAPDANVADMRAALSHPSSVVITLPELNHLFQPAVTGAMSEYYDIEITFDEGAMKEIVTWLDELD